MKALLKIKKEAIERQNLCLILMDARECLLEDAVRTSRLRRDSAAEIRMSRGDADCKALTMARRCMRVYTFDEALSIVKEYVDIQIV